MPEPTPRRNGKDPAARNGKEPYPEPAPAPQGKPLPGPVWVSVRQVVERLNNSVSKTLVYDLAERKVIRSAKLGGKLLIDWTSVEAVLVGQLPAPAEPPAQPPPPPPEPPPEPPPTKGRKRRRKGDDFQAYYSDLMRRAERTGGEA